MKKLSYYNFWIENGSGQILYNSLSDAVIPFKEEEIEDIQYYMEHLDEFEINYPAIFTKFQNSGFIIDADFNEMEHILFQNRYETLLKKNYHLTINPTLQCNYKCWYCCVEEAETKYEQRRMDDETVERVKKHISHMFEQEHITRLHLDWFGGEPLMYFNEVIYPIASHGLKQAQEFDIPFAQHATTNAYYMDDHMIDKFNDIRLTNFQIPLDGHEKKHNSVKKMGDEGHYRKIIRSVNSICERVENAYVILRINYDQQTLKTILPVIDDLHPENRNKILVDFQRVWQVAVSRDESGNNQLLIDTRKAFIDAGFKTYYGILNPKPYRCCYSDSFYHRAVNYDGRIFKCTARDYSDEWCIGNFNEDGSISYNSKILSMMYSDATFKNEKCMKCKILPLCYGPCIQKFYEIKMGKSDFSCLYEGTEMSLDSYVIEKIKRQKKPIIAE